MTIMSCHSDSLSAELCARKARHLFKILQPVFSVCLQPLQKEQDITCSYLSSDAASCTKAEGGAMRVSARQQQANPSRSSQHSWSKTRFKIWDFGFRVSAGVSTF